MPRYYFDVQDNDEVSVDETGHELLCLSDVRNEAISSLPEMAMEELPDGPTHIFRVNVRDDGGAVIFTASLELKSAWLNGGQEETAAKQGAAVDKFPLA